MCLYARRTTLTRDLSRGGARSFEGLEPRSANPTGTGSRPHRQIGSALLSLSFSFSRDVGNSSARGSFLSSSRGEFFLLKAHFTDTY